MTHDSHATGSSRQSGRRTPRPDLGRPSLFADFDQESVEDIDPQRIRLLSTLESQRGARARPRSNRMPTGRHHPWLTRVLMVAMGLGMLVMLMSFIQLLRRPPPELRPQQALAATATPLANAAPAVPAAPTEAAEIIDLEPPAGGVAASPVLAAAQLGPLAATPASAPQAVEQLQPPQQASRAAPAPTAVAASEQAARQARPIAQRTGGKRDAGASHDDVALVEAMLAHAGPRKAPPPPTEALRQCGADSSPEASVCRARVCVQHPSLPACHTP